MIDLLRSASSPRYVMLAASLPHLPHFERTKRLPIGPERLESRMRLLDAADLDRLQKVRELLSWQRRSDDEAAAMADWCASIDRWQAGEPDAQVRELIGDMMSRRSLLAALRRRRAGLPAPGRRERWGYGPWMDKVRRCWHEAHFGLAYRQPWLVRARELMEGGDALELQRLSARLDWDGASKLRRRQPNGYAGVLAYHLHWDVLHDWLRHDAEGARRRLEALVALACPTGFAVGEDA
ncbi:hypothetical protein [Methyloversatilis sp. XJ19-49]|uniref:hypothetical protein n=1 Tax=Methyloversatilis sp. XJ19-49 TaxID=2963429 RepID=UPI00211CF2F8|nr:hypothetical protein [Methyloversatilis sp. XJ19-49]MCQ9377915.1 hypothetical protein [Methyloversatilis sp. XJ19-49]